MQLRTHKNGGKASLQEVADAWKKEVHSFHWSESESDTHAVAMAKKLQAEEREKGPAIPNPLNIHED